MRNTHPIAVSFEYDDELESDAMESETSLPDRLPSIPMAAREPVRKGRKSFITTLLTEEKIKEICDLRAERKLSMHRIADQIGIGRATLNAWMGKGRVDISNGINDTLHARLVLAYAGSENSLISGMMNNIERAANEGDWHASRALLQVLFPREFLSPTRQSTRANKAPQQNIQINVMDDGNLTRLREFFNDQRQALNAAPIDMDGYDSDYEDDYGASEEE